MIPTPRTSSPQRPIAVGRAATFVLTLAVLSVTLYGAHRNRGALDATFGIDGRVTTDFGRNDTALAVAVTPLGQIVAAGYTMGPGPADVDIALARYNPDGSLDASFGTAGRVMTDLGAVEVARAVAVTRRGDTIVAGTISRAPGANDFLLLRYSADGSLDPGFGDHGVVVIDLFDTNDEGMDMAVMANGDIVVAGTIDWSGTSIQTDFGIARFTSDGSLDQSFGSAGKAIVDFGGREYAAALAVRPNGAVVVAGTTMSQSGGYDVALARLTSDGRLDDTFGVGGRVVTDFGRTEILGDVALMPNGSIVVVGTLPLAVAGGDFLVARYRPNGDLDRSFGVAGRIATDFGLGQDAAFGVQTRPDGTILVAGRTSRTDWPLTFDNFALAQYDTHGRLDGEFGTAGLVVTDFGQSADEARALAFLPGGGVVAAGQTWSGEGTVDFALAVYR